MHWQASAEKPARRTFGLADTDHASGTVEQHCPSAVLDEHGAVPLGAICVLADQVLGSLVSGRLADGQIIVTSHLHLEVLRPPEPGSHRLIGRNTGIDLVPGSAFTSGAILDRDGTELVRTSGRFAIIDGDESAPPTVDSPDGPRAGRAVPVADDGHPLLRDPIHRCFGTRVVETTADGVTLGVVTGGHLGNERGGVHGGVGAAIGERAGAVALAHVAGRDHHFRTVELRVLFLRPIPADGSIHTVEAAVGHLGRTTATTTARLVRADGKPAVQVDAIHTGS